MRAKEKDFFGCVGLLLIAFILTGSARADQDASASQSDGTNVSNTFPIYIHESNGAREGAEGRIYLGEVTIQFEKLIEIGTIHVSAAAQDSSPSGSVLPRQVTPVAYFSGKPVWITIKPDENLKFRGLVRFHFNISSLPFDADGKQRLFKAPGFQASLFESINVDTDSPTGGLSTDGDSPSFSEFVFAADERDLMAVINSKMAELWNTLEKNRDGIFPELFHAIESNLLGSLGAWLTGDFDRMNDLLVNFNDLVDSGEKLGWVPDLYSNAPSRPSENIGGALRAESNHIRYLLRFLHSNND